MIMSMGEPGSSRHREKWESLRRSIGGAWEGRNDGGGRLGLRRPRIFQERILLALDPFEFFAQLGAGRIGDLKQDAAELGQRQPRSVMYSGCGSGCTADVLFPGTSWRAFRSWACRI